MQSKRKQIIYLIIFFVSVGASIWIWFGGNDSPIVVPESEIITASQGGGLSDAGGLSDETINTSEYLPFGTEFETDLYSKPEFLELRPTAELIVTPDELGLENPFSGNTVPVDGG
ncbi:MAG: hypothetical protein A2826_02900 [Candidatus Doudnabacteria bacterium RIFCSPHIGHO2_01_FULL_43_23]|uniref:Uncharacterized protein n=1 Tax=Candidatus Doudnabacteria bacterium RIFCSPHIGHO2_01_FULL_43_23 TaxID=1817822 RepID=A0A1F5NRT5_9BACT|nr:MAG: hypothetical protein A2826_02900 [Candidatus Doudnabacteria bacterium RIFCSPHIGHO2_01_FULL_43_23]